MDKGDERNRADSRADSCHMGRWHLFWGASEPAVMASPTGIIRHLKRINELGATELGKGTRCYPSITSAGVTSSLTISRQLYCPSSGIIELPHFLRRKFIGAHCESDMRLYHAFYG